MTKTNKKTEEPVKAVAYLRSALKNDHVPSATKGQIDAIVEYAEKNGYLLEGAYTDDGFSGNDVDQREALQQMLQHAKVQDWKMVLVYDYSRLARNLSLYKMITEELRESAVNVVSVTESDSPFLAGMQGIFAEYERSRSVCRHIHIVLKRP